jgi:CRP-like cAMP-binding protein
MNSYEEILKTVSIFSGLGQEEIRRLAKICSERRYHEAEIIFVEHTEGDELFVILEGEVSISLELASEEDAMPLVLLRAGDVFGELSVVDESPRSATARSLRGCRVVVIGKEALDALMESDHDLGFKVMRNLARLVSKRVRSANQKILDNVSWGMI